MSLQSATEFAFVPAKAGVIRVGEHVQINGHPCKVVNVVTTKVGKHGHSKTHFTGIDVLRGKKHETCVPSSATVYQPVVTKKEYQLIGLQNGYLTLMDDNCNVREDVSLSECDMNKKVVEEYSAGKELMVMLMSAPEGDIEKCEIVEVIIGLKVV